MDGGVWDSGFEGSVLAAILQQAPIGLVVVEGSSGRILLYNAEAERIWRRPLRAGEEIWAYRLGEIFRVDGRPYHAGELPLARSIRNGEVITEERARIRRLDGTWADLLVSSGPVLNERGKIAAGVAAYVDVSARLRAEERLQGLVDSVDGIVWELDLATFRFTFVSQQAVRLLGYPIEDWYQPDFWVSILDPADREWAVAFCLRRTQEMQAHDFEYRVRARDGRVVWLRDIVSVIVESGAAKALRGIMVDITVRRQMQADREHLLASEHAAREAAELNAVKALEAIRLRDQFLSVASHELKTPITSLLLSAQSLEAAALSSALARPDMIRAAQITVRQSQRLGRLIDEMLDISRFQTGQFELRVEPSVDLCELVHVAIARLQRELTRAGCAVTLDAPVAVIGRWDPVRLDQVITNLLTNALKFGAGSSIEIAVHGTATTATLSVTDHGIGIAPEAHARIFDLFERDVSAKHYGGLGIGLYAARQIIERHRGEITVRSELGRGATFTVDLPR